MDYGRSKISPSAAAVIPDEYLAMGALYADRRGRTGAMASLATPTVMANYNRNTSSSSPPVRVLYPGTARLSGGLLTSLIRSTDLDPNYVQRFQHIAIIAQLADAILSVAQATGKCIVPVDFDNDNESQEEECSCKICSKERHKKNNGVAVGNDKQGGDTQGSLRGKGKEKEEEEGEIENNNNNLVNVQEWDESHADTQGQASTNLGCTNSTGHGIFRSSPSSSASNKVSAFHH